MHGTVYRDSESCRSLRRSSSQHMRSVLQFLHSDTSRINLATAGNHHSSIVEETTTNSTTNDSFFKDDRKISVGDCALFKPSQDSPPFIGLIRCLKFKEDRSLHLGVNWLYRLAELKLGKGILLDSAPNEIFYSFHEDETPAASLLHPCKVAFLPRSVELPTGTWSYVCRRVYDMTNKCLWWLTDQDYINERQEEVDLLLHKTRTEMHATLQPVDRSPKQVNSPSSTAKVKPGCDGGQNGGTSFSSHAKGKKRDRGDYGADTVKRERFSRHDEGDSVQCKSGTNLKSEIRITDKGGVTDLDGVDKLIHLMQSNKMERSRDLLSRSMLAGVMAATDKADCLNGFVQMRGLPVLDEWLQDIHRGKIGDCYSLKDGDKSVEEFLLILLRALDKLPVNLNALQMCNIGRSVNHLRSHKNLEIQRKARSLVDTWKKRVEAEMISIDTKSGSTQGICVWPSKSRLSEASHAGSRTPGGSDIAMKGSVTHNSPSKTTSARSSHGDSNIKPATSSPEPLKSSYFPASDKEMQPRVFVGGTSEVPLIREDRSSSSNQPNNCNHSLSGKEDGKVSAGLITVNKVSSITTRSRKASGFSGGSGNLKETSSDRVSSAHKSILEKSQSTLSERVFEGPISEGSSHKLIVKIPSRVRSPPPVVSGKSQEDPSFINNNTSSEVLLDKHEQFDQASKDKSNARENNVDSDMNVESWQSSDLKDLLVESGEAAGSPTTFPDEEQSMTTKDSPTNQSVVLKHEASFNPMNALIESCVKYSVGNSSPSLEDEVGMNLLASVATRELSRFDVVSPTSSTETSRDAVAENSVADEPKLKSSPENHISSVQNESNIDEECDDKKQATVDGSSLPEDRLHLCKKALSKFDGDIQCNPSPSEVVQAGGDQKHTISSNTDSRSAETEWKTTDKFYEKTDTISPRLPISADKVTSDQFFENIRGDKYALNNPSLTFECKNEEISVMTDEKTDSCLGEGNLTVEIPESSKMLEGDDEKDSNERMAVVPMAQCKVIDIGKPEFSEEDNNANLPQSSNCRNTMLHSTSSVEINTSKIDENDIQSCIDKPKRPSVEDEVSKDADLEIHRTDFCSISNDLNGHKETNVETTEVVEYTSSMNPETPGKAEFDGSKPSSIQLHGTEKCSLTVAGTCSSITKESDSNNKIKFDLNEGFSVDDGKYGDPVNIISSLSPRVQISNLVPVSLNSVSGTHSAPITVAAAAKGPFVPPEDLMRSRGELGWKGSAATSAFRPAEPRKCLDTSFGSTNLSYSDPSASNNSRILLDIDLNVPDERVLEEMASRESALAVDSTTDFVSKHATSPDEAPGFLLVRGSGGLDLDLNRVDYTNDHTHFAIGSSHHKKDFDLNDGPVVDNSSAKHLSTGKKLKGSIPSQLPDSGFAMNNPVVGSFPSWFPPGNTYSTVAIPSILPNRVDQPFPVFPPNASPRSFSPIGVAPFTHDLYRGPVLSSSPAVPFPSNHFQFPVFPFGTTFPLSSATFSGGANSYADSSGARFFAPPVNSQYLGPFGSVTSQYARPYAVNLQDNISNGVLENGRKWGRPGLDLNAGPGAMETEVREESSIHHSVAISQAVMEEHSWLHPASGELSKRKEPEGGWDSESIRYKFSWQ